MESVDFFKVPFPSACYFKVKCLLLFSGQIGDDTNFAALADLRVKRKMILRAALFYDGVTQG